MAFWREKPLEKMNRQEWESLCDGCGKCCLHKLEDDETGEIHYTNVACRFLDPETIKCGKYITRQRYVGNCVVMTVDLLDKLPWMPSTCAYRLLYEGKELLIGIRWLPVMTKPFTPWVRRSKAAWLTSVWLVILKTILLTGPHETVC